MHGDEILSGDAYEMMTHLNVLGGVVSTGSTQVLLRARGFLAGSAGWSSGSEVPHSG